MKLANTRRVAQSITRPNDTNAYTAGDVIATATSGGDSTLAFTGLGPSQQAPANNNARGYITGAVLIDSAVPATAGEFELWLFNAAPADQNDNAAFAPADAELTNELLGVLQFSNGFDTGNNRVYMAEPDQLPLLYDARTIYGVLVVRNAYTPVANEVFTVILNTDCNDL